MNRAQKAAWIVTTLIYAVAILVQYGQTEKEINHE